MKIPKHQNYNWPRVKMGWEVIIDDFLALLWSLIGSFLDINLSLDTVCILKYAYTGDILTSFIVVIWWEHRSTWICRLSTRINFSPSKVNNFETMRVLIYSQTTKVAPLKFGPGKGMVFSFIYKVWSFIIHVYKIGPRRLVQQTSTGIWIFIERFFFVTFYTVVHNSHNNSGS